FEVELSDLATGDGRAAGRHVKGALRLAQVVEIGGRSRDMPLGTIVDQRAPHGARNVLLLALFALTQRVHRSFFRTRGFRRWAFRRSRQRLLRRALWPLPVGIRRSRAYR